MKKLTLLWLLFFNSGAFSQTRQNNVVAEIDFNQAPVWLQMKQDTIRATLLITNGHMTIAHEKPGYVVFRSKDTLYLDDRRIAFKQPVKVWSYKVKP